MSFKPWTDEEVAAWWREGFSRTECSHCKRTANLPLGGFMFMCACGHYIRTLISDRTLPLHVAPDVGPTAAQVKRVVGPLMRAALKRGGA